MASIEIKADKVIKACEKMIEALINMDKEEREICDKKGIPYYTCLTDRQISEMDTVKKIKKLAEYAIKPVEINGEWSRSSPQEPITITHNDFELIGEFL